MLHLPAPADYWSKLDSLLRNYVWNGKRPKVIWSALQGKRSAG